MYPTASRFFLPAVILVISFHAVALAIPAYSPIVACDDGWVPAFNSCFLFNTQGQFSWTESRQECAIKNADLMQIPTDEQQSWISVQTEEYHTEGWWVGLAYVKNQGWTWSRNGDNIDSVRWRVEPDNYDNQDCCAINEFGYFSDEFCTSKLGYICTYNISRGELCPLTSGWFISDTACYYFSQLTNTSQHLTWEDAKTYCLNLNTNKNYQLLRIANGDQLRTVMDQLSSQDAAKVLLPWWTGLNDLETEGKYVWQDGNPANMSLISWDNAPSADRAQHRDCAVMYQGGRLEDTTCDKRAHFVCEKPAYATHLDDGCGTWKRGGRHCYWFATGRGVTWSDASGQCQRAGADLLKVDSLDEVGWLGSLKVGPIGSWIGLTDSAAEGQWVWSDGSPSAPNLLNWNREPNNAVGTEHCVTLTKVGTYNDVTCTDKSPYICEYSKDNGVACPDPWVDRGNACYYFSPFNVTTYLTWYEVKDACNDLLAGTETQAYRLAINDMDEQKWLNQQLPKRPGKNWAYWIGLNDLKNHGIWTYDEKFNSNYDPSVINWSQEPNNFDGKENCAVMYEGGTLNDMDCGGKAFFICEKSAYGVSAGATISTSTFLAILASFITVTIATKY